MPNTTFDLWSSTKSATGIAFGLLLDDSLHHKLPRDVQISLDTPIYDFVPEGFPLTDPQKQKIKLRMCLAWRRGFLARDRDCSASEWRLKAGSTNLLWGRSRIASENQPLICSASRVKFGSTPMPALLICHCFSSTRRDVKLRTIRRIECLTPLALRMLVGTGREGMAYRAAHESPQRPALVRTRLCAVRLLDGAQRTLNPSYGYTFWVNTDGALWPTVPRDAFAFRGFTVSRCYVVPSLDLVVVRLGYAPPNWGEETLLPAVVGAVVSSSLEKN